MSKRAGSEARVDVRANVGMAGHFTLIAHGGKRGRVELADFDNMILDAGLNILASGATSVLAQCHVGTGSTPAAANQTALANKVAATGSIQSPFPAPTYVAGPPPYIQTSQTWRFGAGAAAGNLTEVGVGWSATNLFSRALIVDGSGNLTTITVLSDESLDVVYTIRAYPPAADITGSVVLAGVTYNYVMRASQLPWSGFPQIFGAWGFANASVGVSSFGAWNGSIGPITGAPSGGSVSAQATLVAAAYSNNSLQRTIEFTFDLNTANLAGGIKSLNIGAVGASTTHTYQIEFTPNIPKDGTKRLKLNFTFSVGRGPVP